MACIFCGSKFHDYRSCPIMYKIKGQKKASLSKQDYFGQTPNVFVGKFGYPNVNVGLLNTEHYTKHDDPLLWSKENTPINEIVDLRSNLVNANFNTNIKNFKDRFLEMSQEVSMAKKPVDVEINLKKKPIPKLSFNQEASPHGPSVGLKKASITENPYLNPHIEKATYDTDLKSTDALNILFRKGIDEHSLTKAFTLGNFGIKSQRKLVPTRWGITAVDDTLGKTILKEIKDYAESDCLVYAGGHYGNYYLILFFDDLWQYELFEQFVPQKTKIQVNVEHDYEPYTGRKEYVKETAGGYYAARLPILQRLKELKKQSSVLAIRVITEEYTAPLGVWVVREAVKKTLASEPLRFGDRELMLKYAVAFFKKKFGYDVQELINKKSILVNNLTSQSKLSKFF